MERKSGTTFLLSRYVLKEFFKNFILAFVVFFVVFFINTILLLVQKILIKNVSFSEMLYLIILYMPQFLVYVFPFSTLTSSSMVLSDLSSSNEFLALRSVGISRKMVYLPIILLSLVMSIITFLSADVLHPFTSKLYKEELGYVMAEFPTMEIDSNSVNTVGDVVLSNGKTDEENIYNILLMSKDDENYNKTITSEKGSLTLLDPLNFIYSLELTNPEIMLVDTYNSENMAYSKGEDATFYLDFSKQIPSLSSDSTTNLPISELRGLIKTRNKSEKEDRRIYYDDKEIIFSDISRSLIDIEEGRSTIRQEEDFIEARTFFDKDLGKEPFSYYGQYYKSELTKKIALSLACFFLTLLSLPLSDIKVKKGIGALFSILLAVAYWYMLFASQLISFDFSVSPYLIVMAPDLLIGLIALIFLYIFRKAR